MAEDSTIRWQGGGQKALKICWSQTWEQIRKIQSFCKLFLEKMKIIRQAEAEVVPSSSKIKVKVRLSWCNQDAV